MKGDWIERCVDAARHTTSDVASAVTERLKAELETQLSVRSLRPRESSELADQLVSLSFADRCSMADPSDADQNDLS
jgi:hypothetical protein